MIFLAIEDFKVSIKLDMLYDLLDWPVIDEDEEPTEAEQEQIDDAEETLDIAENTAIDEARSYLNSKFVVDEIFTEEGHDTYKTLVAKIVDITLYQVFLTVNPKTIPDIRVKRYDDAIKWLEDAVSGDVTPGFPRPQDNSKDTFLWGSNPKRDHYH